MSAPEQLPDIDNGLLRFLTCGSVDDGKSTLIGRLLFDTKTILADTLNAIEKTSARRGMSAVDLSLLTDGLQAEREQGITIDVAYRYFSTGTRKYIIADAPGHEQYTRNMVTAAAGSDAAVVLVDITKLDWRQQPVKLLAQTRRHALLAKLLRVPGIVFAVNKLDAVDADAQAAFAAVRASLEAFAAQAGIEVLRVQFGKVPDLPHARPSPGGEELQQPDLALQGFVGGDLSFGVEPAPGGDLRRFPAVEHLPALRRQHGTQREERRRERDTHRPPIGRAA